MIEVRYVQRASSKNRIGAERVAAIGERVEAIKARIGKEADLREAIIADARDPDSPLHRHFTWDLKKASHKWHLHEARRLITCYAMVFVEPDRTPIFIDPANVHISSRIVPSQFVSTPEAMSRADWRAQVLGWCVTMIGAIQQRLQKLTDLDPEILGLVDELRRRIDLAKDGRRKVR